jgi:hypothetical protein
MFTRLSLGAEDGMANADHLIGSLVITVSVIACSEVGRGLRFINIPLAIGLMIAPFLFGADTTGTINSLICGAALIGLSLRRGPVRNRYGAWDRFIR